MPIYKYTGYKSGGGNAAGTIEADGPKDAAQKLKQMGLLPREIIPAQRTKKRLFKRADHEVLAGITRQLAVLLRAGVPLVEALRALTEETKGIYREIFVDIREKVMAGASFSRAIDDYEDIFPEFYRNMVTAAQESGNMDKVLGQLADFLESQERVRRKVSTAMIYPGIMMVVASVVMVILFTFVVPKIVMVFEGRNVALPLATEMLIFISNLFVAGWWLMALAAVALAFGMRSLAAHYKVRVAKLLMEVFAPLYLSRLTRTLSFLLDGGLPVIRAMELAGRSSGNAWIESILQDASVKVSEGASLASALDGLSPVLIAMVGTGERSGKLVEILGRAADSYEEDFDRMVQRFLAYLEPGMILIMAFVVAFIAYSVLLPLFQMNQLVK
jgi:general secretion pathway protein F